MTEPKKNILVAGGGLVGSLIAIMLKKQGYPVTLLEKRYDIRKLTTDRGRSINLVVTSRGLNALKGAGLIEEILKITVPVAGRMMHSRDGQLVYQPYGRDPSECNYSISRGDLNKFLLQQCEAVGVELRFDCTLLSADFRSKKVTISQTGQTQELNYDILLGTDGAGSILRTEMSKCIGPQYFNSTEYLSADYKELFLPAPASGQPALQKNALHIWPRGSHMMMALPNLDGSYTMTLYLPKEGDAWSFAKIKTAEDVQRLFTEEFSDAISMMPDYVKDFLKNPQGSLGTVRSAPWTYSDSVALLGDSAHAIVPFFGQGMNLGFEDCVYLEKFLQQEGGNWQTALAAFDQFQRPNANAIAEMALENFIEMSSKVADNQFLQKKKIEAAIEKALPEVYRSRYGMITYTLIPYALAQQAGRIQDKILDEVYARCGTGEVDLSFAKAKIESDFLPFVKENNLDISRFQI